MSVVQLGVLSKKVFLFEGLSKALSYNNLICLSKGGFAVGFAEVHHNQKGPANLYYAHMRSMVCWTLLVFFARVL